MRHNHFSRFVIAIFAVLMAGLLGACSVGPQQDSSEPASGGGYEQSGGAAEGGAVPQAPGPVDGTERLIIRTQTLRFEVDNTQDAVATVREMATQHDAIVSNMQLASEDGWVYDSPAGTGKALRGWLTVRVPVDGVDGFVAEVSELGKLVYQAETSDDVTQEHVDLTARLANLRAQEERLRELIAQAASVEETLAVEQELWRVRGDIESLDAQVKYLERQAAMATVTIELTEDGPVVEGWGFGEAFRDGIRAAAEVAAFAITFVIASSPLWLVGLALFFIVRTIRRRRRLARGEPVPQRRPRKQPAGPVASTGQTKSGPPAAPAEQVKPTPSAAPAEQARTSPGEVKGEQD